MTDENGDQVLKAVDLDIPARHWVEFLEIGAANDQVHFSAKPGRRYSNEDCNAAKKFTSASNICSGAICQKEMIVTCSPQCDPLGFASR